MARLGDMTLTVKVDEELNALLLQLIAKLDRIASLLDAEQQHAAQKATRKERAFLEGDGE